MTETQVEKNKCNNSCSHCKEPCCSENKDGNKGECQYIRQCGVIGFNCKHA